MNKYILVNGKPKRCDNLTEWGRFMETGERIVGKTTLGGGVTVSTVFLGIDHNFLWTGAPVLWETMIFGGEFNGYQERYTSKEDAEKGHKIAFGIAMGSCEAPKGS